MVAFYCIDCGEAKDGATLQPSTDAQGRYRLGVSSCTRADQRGNRRLSTFTMFPPVKKAKWGHGDGATQWCEECKIWGAECGDPKPAPNSMLCYCGHTIQKR